MTGLPLTGGCNCGAVLFEVTAPDDGLPRHPESRHTVT